MLPTPMSVLLTFFLSFILFGRPLTASPDSLLHRTCSINPIYVCGEIDSDQWALLRRDFPAEANWKIIEGRADGHPDHNHRLEAFLLFQESRDMFLMLWPGRALVALSLHHYVGLIDGNLKEGMQQQLDQCRCI
ncbi:hypothetical protein B0H66DRAFT_566526 [Apodospora peruviana]|uniref:Uncharacterized protein n=1 Tax=Apodospora peruviana TaxID=516989 RepID=A0AAE0HVX6_9PEZI|nr:hypothetical protein B0H66DRAFT_566526 [Apodospora peruviana]